MLQASGACFPLRMLPPQGTTTAQQLQHSWPFLLLLQQRGKLAPCSVQPCRADMCSSSGFPLLLPLLLCADAVLLGLREPTAAAAVGFTPDNQTAAVLPELRELQVPPVSWIHDMRTPPPHIILAEFHRQMGHSTRSEGDSEGAATQWAGQSCLLCTRLACGSERAG